MMRSKASQDSSRGFQVSSEISFLISVRKALPTSRQMVDLTSKNFHFEKMFGFDTVALSFVFDNYCPAIS